MSRDILLTVEVETEPDRVFAALTSAEGLASFWTPQVSGEASEGGHLRFGFEPAPVDLEMSVRSTDRESGSVKWVCQGPWPYWVDTHVEWSVIAGNPTRVLFAHHGWDESQPDVEFGSVAYTWATVLGALKSYTETGTPAPALR